MATQEVTMFEIASALSELNAKGKVKRFWANELGYAEARGIARGCRIDVRRLDDRLIIQLSATTTAARRYPQKWEDTSTVFAEFFGSRCRRAPVPDGKGGEDKDGYSADVSEDSSKDLLNTLRELDKRLNQLK